MATVTIHSDVGAQENKICQLPLFPFLFAMKWWDQMPWPSLFGCWAFSPSSFTFIKRLFSSSSLSAFRVGSSEYLKLLILLPFDKINPTFCCRKDHLLLSLSPFNSPSVQLAVSSFRAVTHLRINKPNTVFTSSAASVIGLCICLSGNWSRWVFLSTL